MSKRSERKDPPGWLIFLTGCIGGIAPTIVQWYTTGKFDTACGVFAVIALTLLAGFIAYIWDEKNLMKVFYIGISAPTIVLSASNIGSPPYPYPPLADTEEVKNDGDGISYKKTSDTESETNNPYLFWITNAYAQSIPHSIPVPSLISPKEGVMMDNGRTDRLDDIIWNFDWSDCEGAKQYHLHVKHQGSKYPIIDKKDIKSSSYQYRAYRAYIAEENRYNWKWRVKAKVGDKWGEWSRIRTFNVEPVNTDPKSHILIKLKTSDNREIRDIEVLIKDIKTNKVLAKSYPQTPQFRIFYHPGKYKISVNVVGYNKYEEEMEIKPESSQIKDIILTPKPLPLPFYQFLKGFTDFVVK